MSNQQLYLAIGIPALSQIIALSLAIFFSNRQIEAVRNELKSELARIEGVLSANIARLEGVLGAKIDALTARVKALEDEMRSPLVKR